MQRGSNVVLNGFWLLDGILACDFIHPPAFRLPFSLFSTLIFFVSNSKKKLHGVWSCSWILFCVFTFQSYLSVVSSFSNTFFSASAWSEDSGSA